MTSLWHIVLIKEWNSLINLNLLWASDATWWHRSGSTLAQVMSCCQNQCWLINSEVQWQSLEGNFARDASAINYWEKNLKFHWKLPGVIQLTHWDWVIDMYVSVIEVGHHWPSLIQILACHLFGDKPVSKPNLAYCWLEKKSQWNLKYNNFHVRK